MIMAVVLLELVITVLVAVAGFSLLVRASVDKAEDAAEAVAVTVNLKILERELIRPCVLWLLTAPPCL